MNPLDPNQYRGIGVKYEPKKIDWTSCDIIPVLQFLWGHKVDEVAMAYVHALRPSHIRISDGMIKCDAQIWRITIYVEKSDRIRKIEQEVEVALPHGIENGYELHGKLSEQAK